MAFKNIAKLAGICCVVAGLSACADEVKYSKAVRSWQGAPVQTLYQAWGNPTSEKQLAHGNRLLTYRVVEHKPIQKTYSPGIGATRTSPQGNNMLSRPPVVIRHHDETFFCETSFEVNHVGVIVSTHFHGNNCVATQEGAKKWAFDN